MANNTGYAVYASDGMKKIERRVTSGSKIERNETGIWGREGGSMKS